MSRRPRVIWTESESADWFNAFLPALEKRRIPTPVTAQYLSKMLEAAREAQLVIKADRRRDMTSVDAIRGDIAERLITHNIFPRNYLVSLRKGKKAVEPEHDPQAQRIRELTEQLASSTKEFGEQLNQRNETISHLEEELAAARSRIEELENRPSPSELAQRWIAETIRLAFADGKPPSFYHPVGGAGPTKKDEPQLPERRKEQLPAFERERRKDPEGFTVAMNGSTPSSKPKFAIVADLVGSDRATIHKELGEIAELRYLDAQAKLPGLRAFNANHGRVILWADHAPHQWERSLTTLGVSYRLHRGSLPSLIEHVRATVSKLKPH